MQGSIELVVDCRDEIKRHEILLGDTLEHLLGGVLRNSMVLVDLVLKPLIAAREVADPTAEKVLVRKFGLCIFGFRQRFDTLKHKAVDVLPISLVLLDDMVDGRL